MLYDLTKPQRIHLNLLLKLQDEKKFNNKRRFRLQQIILRGTYDNEDRDIINNLNTVYVDWRKGKAVSETYTKFSL